MSFQIKSLFCDPEKPSGLSENLMVLRHENHCEGGIEAWKATGGPTAPK